MKKILLLAFLLAGCGGNNPPPTPTYPGRLDPIAGQWTDYGTGTGAKFVGRLANPFWMPLKTNNTSVNYVYTTPQPLAIGGVITLNYTVTGYASFGVADNADIPPAKIRLFIWQANDTGSNTFRWWCGAPMDLVAGDNQIMSCPLDPAVWSDVNGQSGLDQKAGFSAALANPYAMGFTFGGQYFAGHGVWVTVGAASFKVNSFTIQ